MQPCFTGLLVSVQGEELQAYFIWRRYLVPGHNVYSQRILHNLEKSVPGKQLSHNYVIWPAGHRRERLDHRKSGSLIKGNFAGELDCV